MEEADDASSFGHETDCSRGALVHPSSLILFLKKVLFIYL